MTQQLRLTLGAAVATALSALCLHNVFEGNGWLFRTLAAVAVVAACCEGARRIGAPRPLVPVLGLLGLCVYLTVAFASAQALLWVVPTPSVVTHLMDMVDLASTNIEEFAAPVPTTGQLTLLAAGGAGLVALAVDTLAVTYRHPAVAGLPLLALFSVPTSVAPDGTDALTFALGAAGYLALLLTESRERVTRWGRSLDRTGRRERSAPLAAAGRRVGLTAVGAALLVPWALPGIDDGLIDADGPGRGRGGGGSVQVSNPIISLGKDLNRGEPVTRLTYRTDSEVPLYLRQASLDDFEGSTWAPARLEVSRENQVTAGLGTPVGLGSAVETDDVTTDIDIETFDTKWLPLPYPTSRVDAIEGVWVWDRETANVYPADGDDSVEGKVYSVASLDVRPTALQLRNAPAPPVDGFERFQDLPEDTPSSIRSEATRITEGEDSDYDKAAALQEYFRDPDFVYDESAPDGNGIEALAAFLVDKRGYCVHFASAMAVMARSVGIPARVAVGFIPGTEGPDGLFTVTSDAAHAWPELYFEGIGWTRFEPTPGQQIPDPPDYTDPATAEEVEPTAAPSSSASAVPSSAPSGARREQEDPSIGADQAAGGGSTGSSVGAGWIAGTAGVLLLLAAPALSREIVRRRRWGRVDGPRSLTDAAWRETNDLAVDFGMDVPASQTPRQFAGRLADESSFDERTRSALDVIARSAERLQYAATVGEVGDLRDAVDRVHAGLSARASRRQRLTARFLPASIMAMRYAFAEWLAVRLDALEGNVAALRHRLVPRRRTNP